MQEFDIEIKDRFGTLNQVADHLSRIEGKKSALPINEKFLEVFFSITTTLPWYGDLVNYLVVDMFPSCASKHQFYKLKVDAKHYV